MSFMYYPYIDKRLKISTISMEVFVVDIEDPNMQDDSDKKIFVSEWGKRISRQTYDIPSHGEFVSQ